MTVRVLVKFPVDIEIKLIVNIEVRFSMDIVEFPADFYLNSQKYQKRLMNSNNNSLLKSFTS